MNSCRNPVIALLLLPGGMNVEISVRKRKLPALLSVLDTCLWERVGRWLLFPPWRIGTLIGSAWGCFGFSYLPSLCSAKADIKYFHTCLLTSVLVQMWL